MLLAPVLAFMASASLFASTSALPTVRGPIVVVGRRAQIAKRAAQATSNESTAMNAVNPTTGKSHSVVVNGGGIANSVINVHFNGRRDETTTPANDKAAGDHSIIVDASSPAGSSGGGIMNSTINLTVISRRGAAALSSFAHSLRSLFVSTPYHAFPTRQEMSDEAMAGSRLRRVRTVAYVDPLALRAVSLALAEVSSSASTATASSSAETSSSADLSSAAIVPTNPSGASALPTWHLSKRSTQQRRRIVELELEVEVEA